MDQLGLTLRDPLVGEAAGAHRLTIVAAIERNLANTLIDSTNIKIRLIAGMAFGFKSPEALIGLALLSLGGHRPVLPGRR